MGDPPFLQDPTDPRHYLALDPAQDSASGQSGPGGMGDHPFSLALLAKQSLLISTLQVYPAHNIMDHTKPEDSQLPFLLFVHDCTLLLWFFSPLQLLITLKEGHSSVGCIKNKGHPVLYGPAHRIPSPAEKMIKGFHQS